MGFLTSLFGGNGAQFQAQNAASGIVNPLNAQVQNQVQGGLTQEQQLANAINSQNGVQNQSNVYNQLQQIASGQGPNPAQTMLAQSTGQNVANQASLAAGQRGASQNVGLIERQAAQTGAGAQQQAVGQAATLQAQQSLNALNQAGGIAGQQVQNQIGTTQGLNSALQGNQAQTIQAQTALNQANISNAQQQNQSNAQIAAQNASSQNNLLSGGLNALGGLAAGVLTGGAAPAIAAAADATNITNKAHGGEIQNPKMKAVAKPDRFPAHVMVPPHLKPVADVYYSGDKFGKSLKTPKFFTGGMAMKQGGGVPGQSKVQGDSEKNDTVKALLSPGEVVLPKSVTESQDPVGNAAKFMASVLKKKGQKGGEANDFKKALASAIQNRKYQ